MKLFRILAIWCFVLCATAGLQQAVAQPMQGESDQVEMADTLRQDGKIYVVVAVLATILGGLVVYLVSLDRKVSKLEKQVNDEALANAPATERKAV